MEETGSDGPAPPLPNEVPQKVPSKYMDFYHLTQLGLTSPDPAHPLDLCNPTPVDGKDGSGPQGFLSYCKDTDTLPSLNEYYKIIQDKNGKRASVLNRTSELAKENDSSSRKSVTGSALLEDKKSRRQSTKIKDKIGSYIEKKEGSPASEGRARKEPKKRGRKKSESERIARKEEKKRRAALPPIIVTKLEDFPEEAQKLVQKARIPTEKLEANIPVLAHIVRFRTGFNVRTKDYARQEEDADSGDKKSGGETGSGAEPLENGGQPSPPVEAESKEVVEQTEQSDIKDAKKDKEDDIDSDMLEPGIIPKGSAEQFAEGDVKKMYKNLQPSGRGGFGSVFVAKSVPDKCDVAIKKIPHVTKKAKRTNFNEIGFLTFCKHPNIVKFYRSHLVDEEAWLVMEYMHGGTLSEAVDRYQFGESSVAYVAREVLCALEYLHSNNLVHRDLKSANIMLTVEGKIKLIDFGLCVDHTQRKLCHMAGSPFWMPPEMILGLPHGPAADIWSFAICLLELSNGKPPNRKSPIKAMFLAATEGITIPHADKFSEDFKDFLGLCLQIDQTKRATPTELRKHPFLAKADTQDTMKKILAQIFISNAINSLDYGL